MEVQGNLVAVGFYVLYLPVFDILYLLDTACVKCEGQWYECNDTLCYSIPESEVIVSTKFTHNYMS